MLIKAFDKAIQNRIRDWELSFSSVANNDNPVFYNKICVYCECDNFFCDDLFK